MPVKKSGFTLLEVLIALLVFTSGVIVMMGLFSRGLVSAADAEDTTIAMNLAQRRMEEIKNLDFTGIVSEAKAPVSGFPGFQREVAVTAPETDLKQVTVTVSWTFKDDEISVPLVTYISRN